MGEGVQLRGCLACRVVPQFVDNSGHQNCLNRGRAATGGLGWWSVGGRAVDVNFRWKIPSYVAAVTDTDAAFAVVA